MASPPNDHTRVYRIVSPKYPPFDGSGTYRWGSRWISPGRYVVHAAETYALAVLENLVHWQTSALPPNLVSVAVDIPDNIEQEEVDRADSPKARLNDYPPYRDIGDDWVDRNETAVLWVPSVVSPVESIVLFNQQHKDFGAIVVHKPITAAIDPRLLPTTKRTQ